MRAPLVVLAMFAAARAACPRVRLAWLPPTSQINATSPGAPNKYGLEDGIVVRRADGRFSMVASEMYTDPRWVSMRLGVFTSPDGLAWTRARGLRTSTADYTGRDAHSSTWGPFFLHDAARDTWMLSYVAYRGEPSNASGWLNNFEGTIYARAANATGDAMLEPTNALRVTTSPTADNV